MVMWKVLLIFFVALLAQAVKFKDISQEYKKFQQLKKRTRGGDVLNIGSGSSRAHGPFTATKTKSFSEIGLSKSNSKAKASDIDFYKGSYYDDIEKLYNDYKTGGSKSNYGMEYFESAMRETRLMNWKQIVQSLFKNKLTHEQFQIFKTFLNRRQQKQQQQQKQPNNSPLPVTDHVAMEFLESALTPENSLSIDSLDEFIQKSEEIQSTKLKDVYGDQPLESIVEDLLKRFSQTNLMQNFLIENFITPLMTVFMNEDGTWRDDIQISQGSGNSQIVEAPQQAPVNPPQETEPAPVEFVPETMPEMVPETVPAMPETVPAPAEASQASSTPAPTVVPEQTSTATDTSRVDLSHSSVSEYVDADISRDDEDYKQLRKQIDEERKWARQQLGRRNPYGFYATADQWDMGWDEWFETGGYPVYSKKTIYNDRSLVEDPNVANADAEADGDQTFTDTNTDVIANKMSESKSVSISETTDKRKRKICLKFQTECFCNEVDKCINRRIIQVCKRLECTKYGFKCPYTYCEESKCRVYEKHTFKCVESFCVKFNSDECGRPKEDYFIRCLEYDFECREKQACVEFAEDCIPHCERICVKFL